MNIQHFFNAILLIINEMSPYILLGFLIAGFLHEFIKPEVMSRHLSGHGWKPVLKAALFGIPLPLCSCGVLPTAISLHRQGASKGASTSFLIATPQTGVDSIAATYALLGLPFAILRPVAALAGALWGGIAVERANGHDTATQNTPAPARHMPHPTGNTTTPIIQRILNAIRYGLIDMVASVGKWLVIGLIVAAIITVAVPDSLFLSLSEYPILAMLVMVAVAIPMYICATGSIPIALSLMLKGLTPGVAFVLLMAGPAANFASVMLLRKELGMRTTAIYIASVIVTAIAFGLAIDYIMPTSWFTLPTATANQLASPCHAEFPLLPTLCSIFLLFLLAYAYFRTRKNHSHNHNSCNCGSCCDTSEQPSGCDGRNNNESCTCSDITPATTTYHVEGMRCNHCKETIEKALTALTDVRTVNVDLAAATVTVTGTASPESVKDAISTSGFNVV